VLLSFGLVALGAYQLWFADQYRTAIGEQRLVRLSDGTRVSLNSDSQVVVDYDTVQRRVRLKRGEAFFEVAKDMERPFIVSAGAREVTALGTAFVVRYEEGRTAVTLVEGKVAVTSAGIAPLGGDQTFRSASQSASGAAKPKGWARRTAGAAEVFTLAPGQRLTLGARSPPRMDEPRIDAVTAWRRGEVVLPSSLSIWRPGVLRRVDVTSRMRHRVSRG